MVWSRSVWLAGRRQPGARQVRSRARMCRARAALGNRRSGVAEGGRRMLWQRGDVAALAVAVLAVVRAVSRLRCPLGLLSFHGCCCLRGRLCASARAVSAPLRVLAAATARAAWACPVGLSGRRWPAAGRARVRLVGGTVGVALVGSLWVGAAAARARGWSVGRERVVPVWMSPVAVSWMVKVHGERRCCSATWRAMSAMTGP